MRKPPLHFSNFSSHRGTTHTFGAGPGPGALAGKAGAAPVAKAPRRSMTALDISSTPFVWDSRLRSTRAGREIRFNHQHVVSSQRRTLRVLPPPSGYASLLRLNLVARRPLSRQ